MDDTPENGFRTRPWWLLVILAAAFGQAGLTHTLFGTWANLTDARPITDGRHPLHFYHGLLGAETFRQRQSTACFDPNFQAGYPKTPVFDGGCRPAEFVLALAGRRADAGTYKLSLFLSCLLVPGVFAAAARGLGLSPPAAGLAAVTGCGLWWTAPVRTMLNAGDSDVLLAGLSAVVFVCWLSRYHWEPGLTSWLMLAGSAVVGWYGHPVLMLALAPVVGLYYLAVAPRHGPAWHLGLFGAVGLAITSNLWWLWDWARFWWLRQPSVDDVAPFPTWGALLDSSAGMAKLFGPAPFGWPLVATGGLGCVWLLAQRHRSAAGLVLLSALSAYLVARLGQLWSPLMNVDANRAAALVSAFAVVPACGWLATAARGSRLLVPIVLFSTAGWVAVGWGDGWAVRIRPQLGLQTGPLSIGLTRDQDELVAGIMTHTTSEARILFEETPTETLGWNWTALLPWLTGRAYLGGLDPDAKLEHAFCRLRGDQLNGRRLAEWTDAELVELCRRYNIGWVVTRSVAATERWERFASAKMVARYRDGCDVALFELDRPRSFVLVGQATWQQADRRKVVLVDVVPADFPNPNGGPVPDKVIVLSLHYQAGLRVSPNTVRVERDPDPHDPIPMIRLRLLGPMSRLVISWENQ